MYTDTKRYVAQRHGPAQDHVSTPRATDGTDRGRAPYTPAVSSTGRRARSGGPSTAATGCSVALADGGMATVYLALDERLDREVALKVMRAAPRPRRELRHPVPP